MTESISLHDLAAKRRTLVPAKTSAERWGRTTLYKGASKEWWKVAFVPIYLAKLVEFHKKVPWVSVEHGPKFYFTVSEGRHHPLRYQISYRGPEYARKWVFRPRVHVVACDWSATVWDSFNGQEFKGTPEPLEAPRYGMNDEHFAFLIDRLLIGEN